MTADDSYKQPHHWPLRVYYEDTDAAGVVYYANYLRFCERARTEWLRSLGFDQSKMRAETGLVFVVTRVEADYLLGAELDDCLLVVSSVSALRQVSLTFEQIIVRDGKPVFKALVTVACVDWTKRRAARLPDSLRTVLEKPA